MSVELLINVTPSETRVAITENGAVQEVSIERPNRRGLVGNVYKGRVCRVLPGMQAAFVEVGLERTAFLHASDVAPRLPSAGAEPGAESGIARNGENSIARLLHEGQEILVQVIKDPLGTKGARLTTHISIPSCYLVLLPGADTIGISQRIEDEGERTRLRELMRDLVGQQPGVEDRRESGAPQSDTPRDGYILRTAAETASDSLLRADMYFVQRMWKSLCERAGASVAPCRVHEDPPLAIRTLRELSGTEIERVRIDSRETAQRVRDFARRFIPEIAPRVESYTGEAPIFELYGIEDEIQKALKRKVQLKSGGHLVIDQTEAMTTVDVNTGAYVGHRNLEETIFKTNLEAAQAITRQLRLRNLGGIIIIDFIDMESVEHRRQVLRALERHLERDHARTQISEVSALGLVQMTRKRTRESLEHVLCEPCPTCAGRGTIKTPDTVCYEIFREIMREARQYDDAERLIVLASQEVIETLVDEESRSFAQLEAFIGKPITLQVENIYHREQYDVVLV